MEQNGYFKTALSDFVFDAANAGAIRHLAGKGCTVKQIMENLDFPASYEKVQKAVWEDLLESGVILLEEPGGAKISKKETYIKEQGKFGKTSFRRMIVTEEESRQVHWKETRLKKMAGPHPADVIKEKHDKNGRETSYVSCDFGILKEKDKNAFESMLFVLDDRQNEYVNGLPWAYQRVYHRMDVRMTEIICRLLSFGQYTGSFYFMESGEKITVE